ncbi:hypothetical protein JK164_13490 [Gluconobacter kondonii]|nr:hypothetical protein [Gluconobacter kondonii]MBS1066925.1 hypothetical protein [Gluconobacter kondonii]
MVCHAVSPASAVRWCTLAATTGSPAASPRGGDRLSHRIEAQAECIHALIAEKDDLTLSEIRARLAENGHHFAIGTLWRFFARHKITWKKRPLTRRSRIAPLRAVPARPEAAFCRATWSLENNDIRRRVTADRHRSAHGA